MVVHTDQIIMGVRKYPVLFDPLHPDYKCKKMRYEVWNRLADELSETTTEIRKKWKNIRDCYKKYLRSTSSGAPQSLRSYKNWQWADTMEFCKPFILMEPDINNRQDQEENNRQNPGNIDDDDVFSEITSASVNENVEESPHILEVKHNSEPTSTNKIINRIHTIREQDINTSNGLEAIDLIFLGYSNTVKSFTPTKQALIKMKIAQIIMEEELQEAEGIPFQSHVICQPLTSGSVSNSTIEFNVTPRPQVSDPLTVEPTNQRRGKKRKVNHSAEEVCTSSFETSSVNGNSFVLKSETKDISDSD